MKKYIITFAIAAVLFGCTTKKAVSDNLVDNMSWKSFCDAHGYSYNDTTTTVIDEYLDTWCGSTAEEEAQRKQM